MNELINLLAENPLLLLFSVCAIGYALGAIPIGKRKSKLGPAMILFVGLFAGALDPRLSLPSIVDAIGLVLLMYTVGLQASAGFFSAFSKRGLKELVCAILTICIALVLTIIAVHWISGTGGFKSAIFAGVLSNATGLAEIVDLVTGSGGKGATLQAPVVAFSLTFPLSIVVPMLVIVLFQKFSKIDLRKEAQQDSQYQLSQQTLETIAIKISNPEAFGKNLEYYEKKNHFQVAYGGLRRGDKYVLATGSIILQAGDVIEAVGNQTALDNLTKELGEKDPSIYNPDYESHRVFVSRRSVVGITLDRLHLIRSYGFKVMRVRRGDVEFVPDPHTKLELGDRLRVIAISHRTSQIAKVFGDSIAAVSEIDYLSFGLGIAVGISIGLVPFPCPGGNVLRLGAAGGPLIAGLILGKLDRTEFLVWQLPYSINKLLQQLGIVLFSVGIGTRSGHAFYQSLIHGNGFEVIGIAALLALLTGLFALLITVKVFKISLNRALGVYSGALTQPIVLAFTESFSGNEISATPYSSLFPFCIIIKILSCELLYTLLR